MNSNVSFISSFVAPDSEKCTGTGKGLIFLLTGCMWNTKMLLQILSSIMLFKKVSPSTNSDI